MPAKIWLGVLILVSWATGCATLNPGPTRENFAPLFVYSEDEPREGKALDLLGPLFTYRQDTREREVAFRPFFYWKKEEGEYTLLEYLYPLGSYKRTETEATSSYFLVYATRRDLTREPAPEPKQRSFLLAFWGETDEGEKYGGLFPIYGHLKKRFGRDEINFLLWPLYSDSRQGENKTYTLLWPIFTWSRGGDREGFKVWPLLGRDRKEKDYEKTFFLWPIFDFEKRYLYMDDPTKIEMIFPLYVSIASFSGNRAVTTVLWPFFTHARDEAEHYSEWHFPWPFLQWAKGDNKSALRIFPLYGHKYWEGRERGYILLPLYWYSREEDDAYRRSTDYYLLLSKKETTLWKRDGSRENRLRIWPVFYYRKPKDDSVYFYSPAIIPADLEGFERNWIPLLTLYEYRRNIQGASESKFLWGVYVHRKNDQRELREVSFLWTQYRAEDVSYFCILRGLVEYRARGANRALRLFYVPWPVEWERAGGGEGVAEKKELMLNRTEEIGG